VRFRDLVRLTLAIASFAAFAGIARPAHAELAVCDGPEACCPKQLVDRLQTPVHVAVGVAFRGLYNVDDKLGTWDADYYLYEAWSPTPGFFPQTEIVNEINRQSSQFDETILRDGRCHRSRRVHSTLHARYDLRRFPFDTQTLRLDLADAEFDAAELSYDPQPLHLELDGEARDELTAWSVVAPPRFALTAHPFSHDAGAPKYVHATIDIPVHRQVGYYLTRYFLPLFLIVAVALTVFWIHPEDLGSQVGIGVTCLLAVIAFQFAQASTLPAVAYLTFADRVYAICYFAIALALMESVWGNALVRDGKAERAARIDQLCRWTFPLGITVLVALSAIFP
jgi:hypothetical protein